MKIIKNALSDSLCQECLDAIKHIEQNYPWYPSSVIWIPELKEGIQGTCLTRFAPEDLKTRILDELEYCLSSPEPIVQFYIWQPLSGIAWHNDYNRNIGATIYLNERWGPNYGGVFMYQTGTDPTDIHGVIPQQNTMVINDKNEYHMVTPVAFDVPEYRYTLQIWG